MKHTQHNANHQALREQIIQDVMTELINKEALVIGLHSGIVFNVVEDDVTEVIVGCTLKNKAIIYDMVSYTEISIQELTTEQLITMLQMLEEGKFDVEETIYENM